MSFGFDRTIHIFVSFQLSYCLWFSSCSSFNDHYGYKITETEFDNLSKRKWKYKCEMPAFDMPNCKWMGTGESLSKVAIKC